MIFQFCYILGYLNLTSNVSKYHQDGDNLAHMWYVYVYVSEKEKKKKDEEHVITKGHYTEGVHTFLYRFLKNKYINKNNNFIFSYVPFDSPFV